MIVIKEGFSEQYTYAVDLHQLTAELCYNDGYYNDDGCGCDDRCGCDYSCGCDD